jgi:2-polyprenyl-6-hydroxyphenyl methylase/3-demethylubiquinone-9 3-methyltransferase
MNRADARYEQYWSVKAPSPLSDPHTAARWRLLWERLPRLQTRPARLLDCGAGDGSLIAEAGLRGIEAVGLEISATAVERARSTSPLLDLRRHSVEDLPWPVASTYFDAVVSFEVLEHLLEPTALLEGARDALAPGGLLALSTPYHGLVKNLAIAAVRFEQHFAVEGDHIRFFTDRALRRLIESAGFVLSDVTHLGRLRPFWANSVVFAEKMR